MPSLRSALIAAFAAIFLYTPHVFADPEIRSAEGSMRPGARVKLKGDGFGEKPQGKPILFADFERGLEPTAKGSKSKWDRIQNMEWAKEGPDGAGTAKACDGSGKWTLGVDHDSWSREGQKVYIFRRQKLNFLITNDSQNWKIWRMYPASTNYPNIYMASSNGRVFVENVGEESGFWGRLNVQTNEWTSEEIFFQASSMNVKDGVCRFQCNGVEMAGGSVMTRSNQAPAYMTRNYVVHGVNANPDRWSPGWLPSNRLWVDEVYVDTSWSRVMMSDKPLRREGRKWEIEVPVRWANGEIEFTVNTGVFRPGETAYLYVFDSENRSNEVGFPVVIRGKPELASSELN